MRKSRAQLRAHEAHAREQRLVLTARFLQGAIQVVEGGQQLTGEAGGSALLCCGGLARDPLAVVLEVRLRALGESEVLVALGRRLDELVEVTLDLRDVALDRRDVAVARDWALGASRLAALLLGAGPRRA
jgi:hypothetical protein